MTINGKILDSGTGEGLPGATVRLYSGANLVWQAIANQDGYFQYSGPAGITDIVISSTGYIPWKFPASEYQHVWELERDIRQLDPVVITSGSKTKNLLLLALLAVVLLSNKK